MKNRTNFLIYLLLILLVLVSFTNSCKKDKKVEPTPLPTTDTNETFTCGQDVTFNYGDTTVTYGTVIGAEDKCWLDRNLGASQVATSSSDAASFGDLFQWGRAADGHQLRYSDTTSTLSYSDTVYHNSFIKVNSMPYDWRSPQNNNLWQGVNGVNNPCPPGWRIPTASELNAEMQSWSSSKGAFNSPLKLTMAGFRSFTDASLIALGHLGYYWSNTVSDGNARSLFFYNNEASINNYNRALGASIRCIKD